MKKVKIIKNAKKVTTFKAPFGVSLKEQASSLTQGMRIGSRSEGIPLNYYYRPPNQ